jgi:uncharacterized membrane protein
MAVLSITLKDTINRRVNIMVGIVFAVFMHGILHPIDYLAKQDAYYAGLVLVGIVEFVVAALIVWYAYKWPVRVIHPTDGTRAISHKTTNV